MDGQQQQGRAGPRQQSRFWEDHNRTTPNLSYQQPLQTFKRINMWSSIQPNSQFKKMYGNPTHNILVLKANIVCEASLVSIFQFSCRKIHIHMYQPYMYCKEGCGVGVACLPNAYARSSRRACLMPYPLPAACNP